MGPYNNSCRNAKFLAVISVYWPGLYKPFPTNWATESNCVCVIFLLSLFFIFCICSLRNCAFAGSEREREKDCMCTGSQDVHVVKSYTLKW